MQSTDYYRRTLTPLSILELAHTFRPRGIFFSSGMLTPTMPVPVSVLYSWYYTDNSPNLPDRIHPIGRRTGTAVLFFFFFFFFLLRSRPLHPGGVLQLSDSVKLGWILRFTVFYLLYIYLSTLFKPVIQFLLFFTLYTLSFLLTQFTLLSIPLHTPLYSVLEYKYKYSAVTWAGCFSGWLHFHSGLRPRRPVSGVSLANQKPGSGE